MNDQQLAAVKQALEALMVFRYAPPAQRPLVLKAITALQSIISQDALDKKAENARELGLDYEPAVQEGRDWSLLEATQESLREHMAEIKRLKAAQPAPVQEPVAWRYTDARGHYRYRGYVPNFDVEYQLLKPQALCLCTPPTPQPVPVKTYHDGKPWPVQPKPWVGLTDEEREDIKKNTYWNVPHIPTLFDAIEAKLKGKNHG
jgi:hypothetical protein